MPAQIESLPDRARPSRIKSGQAELLEWIGAAYGRRSDLKQATSTAQAPNSPTAAWKARAQSAAALAFDRLKSQSPKNPSVMTAMVGLVIALSALAIFQSRDRTGTSVATPEIATTVQGESPAEIQGLENLQADERAAREQLERAAQEANDAKSMLAHERNARIAAEEKVARLVTETAALTLAREKAESAVAEESARLEAERAARRAAEAATQSAKEELARKMSIAAPAPAAAPEAPAADPSNQRPRAAPSSPVAASGWAIASNAADDANADLIEGQKHFAKGDLDAARRRFERAAKIGSLEGALAIGNTFDPVSLAEAGVKQTGDPARARQWYRRAYEMALRRP